MNEEYSDREVPTDRESPVGSPVIRGDETVTGDRAADATAFDPADPRSLERAADTVRAFAAGAGGTGDHIYMLEGAAACAALVRGEGSYKDAVERAGEEVNVSFIRKWARVHDLPHAIRRQVARGHLAPTAAKHIARVGGEARYQLAWATLDNELTVRQVRSIASSINQGASVEVALREHGVTPGELSITLPLPIYRELRRIAAVDDVEPGDVVADALQAWFDR